MNLKQIFCSHKWDSFRKNTNTTVYRVETTADLMIKHGGTGSTSTGPEKFYEISEVTEVLICTKCGKFHTITY